jgi:hypothetical protein
MNGPLDNLQQWYAQQCDGEWEHSFGIKIETLDNPGWTVMIDLQGTAVEDRPFKEVFEDYENETNWLTCKVERKVFVGSAGPLRLADIITCFIRWVSQTDS